MALRIWVTAKPRSKKQEIKMTAPGEYLVRIQEPAQEGKANKTLVRLLARHFAVPNSAIKILLGETSRKKLIQIG
jgi:uncharacterized protein (TIGR00251 family)